MCHANTKYHPNIKVSYRFIPGFIHIQAVFHNKVVFLNLNAIDNWNVKKKGERLFMCVHVSDPNMTSDIMSCQMWHLHRSDDLNLGPWPIRCAMCFIWVIHKRLTNLKILTRSLSLHTESCKRKQMIIIYTYFKKK